MPLIRTQSQPVSHDDRRAVGAWMKNVSGLEVRVFVTLQALWQIDTSQVRDVRSALTLFDANRARLEGAASTRYDARGPDEGEYEGRPIIVLRSDDIG